MIDQERRHSEAGRIPDPERPPQRRSKAHRSPPATPGREVIDQLQAEVADQVYGEHLRLKGQGEEPGSPDLLEVRESELAVAVDGGGSHQVAHAVDVVRGRLAAACEGFHQVVEQPHAPIGATQHDLSAPQRPASCRGTLS